MCGELWLSGYLAYTLSDGISGWECCSPADLRCLEHAHIGCICPWPDKVLYQRVTDKQLQSTRAQVRSLANKVRNCHRCCVQHPCVQHLYMLLGIGQSRWQSSRLLADRCCGGIQGEAIMKPTAVAPRRLGHFSTSLLQSHSRETALKATGDFTLKRWIAVHFAPWYKFSRCSVTQCAIVPKISV